ncbi:hypothetical protein Patl1_33111 [Pistacia atlantica]|uniref:Uncharacterized protein n=1 Tax=Pistacia atlantica TaxID=434234 RepID=A0ACC1ALV2_9ROSI|nr:hypothetical protein Patl1_33111 [Pistacia atlantica]
MGSPFGPPPSAAHTKSLAESNTSIRFINVSPPVNNSPSKEVHKSVEKFLIEFIDCHRACVKEAIVKHVLSGSNSTPLAGLVVDFFCTSMIDVGNELGVPSYLFSPSSAAAVGLLLYLPTPHGREIEEFDGDLLIPSYVNPVPGSGLPEVLSNKHGGYTTVMNHGRRFKETKGIIVNTFEELDSHAVKSLMNDFDHVPPVYTVGPVIVLKGESNKLVSDETQKDDEIMKWLDHQPDSSVVFLCFGSQGNFGEEQVKEIAVGLDQTGVRFLWSFGSHHQRINLKSLVITRVMISWKS